jgi:hypothetical protein
MCFNGLDRRICACFIVFSFYSSYWSSFVASFRAVDAGVERFIIEEEQESRQRMRRNRCSLIAIMIIHDLFPYWMGRQELHCFNCRTPV